MRPSHREPNQLREINYLVTTLNTQKIGFSGVRSNTGSLHSVCH